jgi:meso-butanediol dehydrogenase / (S,S)-butanediol dehydrogenase / diacetyl reductase
MRLADKVAIITGSGRGIGKGIAVKFAQEGAKVVIVDIDPNTAESTAAEIQKAGGQARWMKTDVTREAEVKAMVAFALKEFGQIDILVNNAGIVQAAPFLELSEQDWDAILAVNLKGIVLCTRATVPEMMKRKSGKIINIASRAGRVGIPYLSSYCASKFAVVGLTQSNAMEFAPHITVNAICPGIVMTYMWQEYLPHALGKLFGLGPEEMIKSRLANVPMKRPQYPEDVAKVALFLASSDGDYITGQAIMDTGGMDAGR